MCCNTGIYISLLFLDEELQVKSVVVFNIVQIGQLFDGTAFNGEGHLSKQYWIIFPQNYQISQFVYVWEEIKSLDYYVAICIQYCLQEH